MKSFSIDDWRPAPQNAGNSLPALPKPETSRVFDHSAAERIKAHEKRARLCWHRSKLYFRSALFYLADAFRHGGLYLIQLSIVFLRRQLRWLNGLRSGGRKDNAPATVNQAIPQSPLTSQTNSFGKNAAISSSKKAGSASVLNTP
jgi:hypothetical protein